MCVNGVNTSQLKDTVQMIDDEVAICRKWTHKMFHLAENGQSERAAAKLKEVQYLLDDVRAALVETQEAIDADDEDINDGVKVELV